MERYLYDRYTSAYADDGLRVYIQSGVGVEVLYQSSL